MLHVEPTSQYKFIAKPPPTGASEANSTVTETAPKTTTLTTTSTAPVPVGSVSLQTNTATHFQAAEHAQNRTLKQAAAPAPGTAAANAALGLTYDGKRMRKAVQRRTVDYNSSITRFLEVCRLETS